MNFTVVGKTNWKTPNGLSSRWDRPAVGQLGCFTTPCLQQSSLVGASLEQATLQPLRHGVASQSLVSASLVNASLISASLANASLVNASLISASLANAGLSPAFSYSLANLPWCSGRDQAQDLPPSTRLKAQKRPAELIWKSN